MYIHICLPSYNVRSSLRIVRHKEREDLTLGMCSPLPQPCQLWKLVFRSL